MNNNFPIKAADLVSANIDHLAGMKPGELKEKYGFTVLQLEKAMEKVDSVMKSDDAFFSTEREIIKHAISDRLAPLKEELSIKSLEILRKADNILSERLTNDSDEIKTKDILSISDVHSKRLARIVGLEEDPSAGGDAQDEKRIKTVNYYVQNVFKEHNDKLEDERNSVNSEDTPQIIEVKDEKTDK